jgi:hypothetical protein
MELVGNKAFGHVAVNAHGQNGPAAKLNVINPFEPTLHCV